MNLPKLSVILTACVAVALSLSACVSPTKVVNVPEIEPLGSLEPSEAYDEWAYWTADPKDEVPAEYSQSMNLFSEELGLGVVFEQPAMIYSDEGWSGVAEYGSLCIIAVGVDEQSAVDGSIMVAVLSRYDGSVTVSTNWTTDYEGIRIALAPYTQWCQAGGTLPEPIDGTEFFPEEQATSA